MPTPSVDEASSGLRYFVGVQGEQPGEAAEPADDLGPVGLLDRGLHQRDGALAGVDVDAGGRVGELAAHGRRERVLGAAGHARAAGLLTGPAGDRALRGHGHRQRRPADPLEDVLAEHLRLAQRDRVLAGEAGGAQPVGRLLGRGDQALLGDVAERVGVDRGADAVDVEAVGDQLGAAGEVDAVEARPLHRRRGDPHVHLDRAGLAQHPDQRALGVAAHDRVVDDDQPLAADDVAQRVELQPDAQLPDRLARLDERAADVGVLDQARGRTGCRDASA